MQTVPQVSSRPQLATVAEALSEPIPRGSSKERDVMVAYIRTPMRIGPESYAPSMPAMGSSNAWSNDASKAADGGAERRMFPRKEIHADVVSKRLDHSLAVHKAPSLTLSMRDLSLGGLSAISDVPMQAGERVTVFFPPTVGLGGWDAYGRVIRCQPSGLGYRIAVQFDMLPAA